MCQPMAADVMAIAMNVARAIASAPRLSVGGSRCQSSHLLCFSSSFTAAHLRWFGEREADEPDAAA